MDIAITPATPGDLDTIKSLLLSNALPTAGVDDHWKTFVLAREGNDVIGCGGFEAYADAALIRSVAVDQAHRSNGVGDRIVRHLIGGLGGRGIREVFLLTTTAARYFEKRGFRVIPRSDVHPQLLASRELQDACPSTATCMRLAIPARLDG